MPLVQAGPEDRWLRLERNRRFKDLFTFSSEGTVIDYLMLDHVENHSQRLFEMQEELKYVVESSVSRRQALALRKKKCKRLGKYSTLQVLSSTGHHSNNLNQNSDDIY